MSAKFGVTLLGMGVSLPPKAVYNEDLTSLVDTSDEWIFSRTGFKARHVVEGDQTVNDLAVQAGQHALDYAGIGPEQVDLIIAATSTPEQIYPATSAVIQHRLGAKNAFGFDTAMACSGLITAMGIASQFIENGTAKTALVIGADTHSRYVDWQDRNTCVLFGDGGGAFVMARHPEPGHNDLLGLNFWMDGSRGDQITLATARDNCPLVAPRTHVPKSAVYMNGREVFKFAVTEVPAFMEATLQKAGVDPQAVDHYILHQANDRIMSAMVERMNIRPEQMVVSLTQYGNTSAASIPLAFNDALVSGQIKPGDTVVLCGFGAGLTITTAVFVWNAVDHRPASARVTSLESPLVAST